jgi:hypothetical protein
MPRLSLLTAFLIILVSSILLKCITSSRSKYTLHPSPLDISGATASQKAGSIFSLPYRLDCVPGPNETASPYTKDLTPGGLCGAQEFVVAQADGYEIVDGIGGSLLDQ